MNAALMILAAAVSAAPSTRAMAAGGATWPFPVERRGGDGRQLVHASGFLVDTGARRPEEAARRFLAVHGAGFGVTPRQELRLVYAPALGRVGPVRFRRTIDGMPVFGGDLVVGVDGDSRAFLVNAGAGPAEVSGRHALGEAAASSAALAAFTGLRGAGPAAVTAGWRVFGPEARAVYRVDFAAQEPAGDWRVYVDGETGVALFREDLRRYASALGNVYEISPTEDLSGQCSMVGNLRQSCRSALSVTLTNLSTGASLTGSQSTVYNCKGLDAPASPIAIPGSCSSVQASGGTFSFTPNYQSTTDDFAAVMTYYHLDKHASFFKALGPTILPGDPATDSGTSRALRGSLPAVVNAYEKRSPYNNAYFSSYLDAMVFGQGSNTDFAYDATVVYHEFTHGVVFAWGDFEPDIDSMGSLDEPGAVNEGTADAMAVSETGHPELAGFIGATYDARYPMPYLRNMEDSSASRTCRGDGTTTSQWGYTGVLKGLDGEVHDDGEIWNGFYWEVYQGLQAAGVAGAGCTGGCEAGPVLQYQALQLAGGTKPTLGSYWQTLRSAAATLYPGRPSVAAYVDCVARRRQLDLCDRTVPLYASEAKTQYVRLRYSPFQMVIQASGATELNACSTRGSSTTAYLRRGAAVQLSKINPSTGSATMVKDRSVSGIRSCSAGGTLIRLDSAGAWYLLFDAPSAWGDDQAESYLVRTGSTGMTSRPTVEAPRTCTFGHLYLGPWSATVPPRGTLPFITGGGSDDKLRYSFSLKTDGSGGSVDGAGVYHAGPTPNTTDVVQLSDPGNGSTIPPSTVTATIQISAGVSVTPTAISVSSSHGRTFAATGGSGTGYAWSLATNASGGSIDTATGAYVAGPVANVGDVVRVVDSLGNESTATVSVTRSLASGGCGYGGGLAAPLLLLALLGLRRRRSGPPRSRAG